MVLLITATTTAQAPVGGADWITAPEISAAIITAVFTISGILLKDYFLKALEERRLERRTSRAIYERYSNPLVTATISLLYRLDEILFKGHPPAYLKSRGFSQNQNPGAEFRTYKKLSTIYRIAVVLGWIQACRREFSYLRVADPGDASDVEAATKAFEHALANGGWVELERVYRLCEIWFRFDRSNLMNRPDIKKLGTMVDDLIWDHLETAGTDDVGRLNDQEKQKLCRVIADCLASSLKTNQVSDASMVRSWSDAFCIIAMREAWVYKDWQSAIGDIMIRSSQSSERKFEVIGYGDFEQFLTNGNHQQKTNLKRMVDIIDGLDLSIEDRFDARPAQLRGIARASAELVIAINQIQGKRSIISAEDRVKANQVVGNCMNSAANRD